MGMAFMGGGKRGLFGAPMASDKMSVVDPRAAEGAGLVQQNATVPTYAKPSTGQFIAGTIGDALQNWSGGQGTFLPGLQRQREYEQQNAQYQRQRADQYSDWERKQAYEAAHPQAQAPSDFERRLLASGVQPGTPEWQKANAAAVLNVTDPFSTVPLPTGGTYIGPRSGLPNALGGNGMQAPAAPVGKLTPLGGATPQGARTFPVR